MSRSGMICKIWLDTKLVCGRPVAFRHRHEVERLVRMLGTLTGKRTHATAHDWLGHPVMPFSLMAVAEWLDQFGLTLTSPLQTFEAQRFARPLPSLVWPPDRPSRIALPAFTGTSDEPHNPCMSLFDGHDGNLFEMTAAAHDFDDWEDRVAERRRGRPVKTVAGWLDADDLARGDLHIWQPDVRGTATSWTEPTGRLLGAGVVADV